MKSAGELPDVVQFYSLFGGGCTKQGDIQNAEEVFKQRRSEAELPDGLQLISLMGGGCSTHGDIKNAEEVFE